MVNNDKYFYAIKVGKNVENIVVNSWKECEEYVIGYPSVYKKFKTEKDAKKWMNNLTDVEVKNILVTNEIHRFYRLKEKLEFEYKFEIPNYFVDEIINNDNYENLCALINLGVINKQISKINAGKLKRNELLKIKTNEKKG